MHSLYKIIKTNSIKNNNQITEKVEYIESKEEDCYG